MGVKKDVLVQIKEIVDECNKLNAMSGFGLDLPFIDNSVNIGKLITKAKVLVSNYFGEENHYYRQIDKYSSMFDENALKIVSSILTALFENLKNNYQSFKEQYITSLKFKKIIEEMIHSF